MKLETHLKVQAFVDGELSPDQASAVRALMDKDPSVRKLADALAKTSQALKENEPVRALPESREFYWSKLSREIEQLEAAKARPAVRPMSAVLWRWLAPVVGVAAVFAFVVFKSHSPGLEMALTEVHMASPEMGAVTFSDQEAGVTMIWLYDRTSNPFTEAKPADTTPPQ